MASIYRDPVMVVTRRMTIPNQNADIGYPVVIGLQNTVVQQKMNNDIINLVNRLIALQVNQLISQGYNQLQLSVTGWYEVKTNERGVLSLTIGNYTIAYPAAHGLTIIKALTFDIDTGKNYLLSEEFKTGSNYITVLSGMIKAQIKTREIPLLNGFDSIKTEQDYYISDKVIVIYFQAYEITPYAYGLPMFPISVYEIQDIIREDSPLGRVAAGD